MSRNLISTMYEQVSRQNIYPRARAQKRVFTQQRHAVDGWLTCEGSSIMVLSNDLRRYERRAGANSSVKKHRQMGDKAGWRLTSDGNMSRQHTHAGSPADTRQISSFAFVFIFGSIVTYGDQSTIRRASTRCTITALE